MSNVGLEHIQQLKREESIERVKWAVQFLKDTEGDHSRVTAVKISNISGLSRAALYKTHLRPLWDQSYEEIMGKNEVGNLMKIKEKEVTKLLEKITLLEMQLKKCENQNANLIREVENEKRRATVYRQDYEDLKERHQKLLHYNLKILRKLHIHGIDVADLHDMELEC